MLKITSTTGNIVKKAVIRDPDSAPQGQPGRIYIDCCGTQITVSEAGSYDRKDHNVCSTCGGVYDQNGWIKETLEAKADALALAVDDDTVSNAQLMELVDDIVSLRNKEAGQGGFKF